MDGILPPPPPCFPSSTLTHPSHPRPPPVPRNPLPWQCRLCHVMSLKLARYQRSSPLHCRSATGACSPAHACSAQPRTTSREWRGARGGLSSNHASSLSNPLCDAFGYHNFDDTGGLGYFLILEHDILLLLDLASTQVLVKTIHKLRHSVKFTL